MYRLLYINNINTLIQGALQQKSSEKYLYALLSFLLYLVLFHGPSFLKNEDE